MRDDLHKTVPLSRSWSRLLRHLSKDRRSAAELAPFIVETVLREIGIDADVGGLTLRETLNESYSDLFADAKESMSLTLRRIQDRALSPSTRNTCEVALGVLSTHGLTVDFLSRVLQAACTNHAQDHIEHVSARVAQTHTLAEATQVRHAFLNALKICDFTTQPILAIARKQKNVHALLETELQLNA